MTNRFSVKLVSCTKTEPEFLKELRETINTDMSLSTEDALEFMDTLEGSEGLMAYTARVSSPKQANPKFAKLLAYCIEHKHWSVFEMVDATMEIETSRAIAQQILRHRSFSFQEFSQRYAAVPEDAVIFYEARRQDTKNRQNSIDDISEEDRQWFKHIQDLLWTTARAAYAQALSKGIAKESARFLLPLNTKTKLYMKGSLRSWIHYCELRCDKATQLEHREIADAIKAKLIKKFPIVAEALQWGK